MPRTTRQRTAAMASRVDASATAKGGVEGRKTRAIRTEGRKARAIRTVRAELEAAERRLTEVLRHISEAQRRTQAETEAPAILVTDRYGAVLQANRAAAALFAIPRQFLLGKPIFVLFNVADRALLRRNVATLTSGNGVSTWTAHARPRSFDEVPVLIAGGSEPATTTGRPLVRFSIRENRAVGERYESLLRQRDLILASSDQGIYGIDPRGEISFASQETARLAGTTVAVLVGQAEHAALHSARIDPANCAVCAGRPGARNRAPALFRRADGSEFPVEFMRVAVADRLGEAASMVLYRDASKQVRAEQEERRQYAELLHAQRVATLGEMVAVVAHELNQPLAAIHAYAAGGSRRLARDGRDIAPLAEALQGISEQALRAAETVRRLRSYLRKGDAKREWVDVDEMVRDAVALVTPEARDTHVTIRTELRAQLHMELDAISLQQVVLNLIRNALEAMHGIEGKREILVATDRGKDGGVELAVSDHGAGVSTEMSTRVFDPFVSTKAHGLGMGLAITRTIVESHRGRVWVEPNTPAGATFRVSLPPEP